MTNWNGYGQAALDAINLVKGKTTNSPIEAWEKATISIFGLGTSSQRKGCPKDAFLGLCQEGLVKGILPDNYTTSVKNKFYAVKAIGIIKAKPELANDPKSLWKTVAKQPKVHNSQMDVVIALWSTGLIE